MRLGTSGVVFVDEVVEHVVDAQLELIQDLIDDKSVLDVLLRPSQDLKDRLSCYHIILYPSASGSDRSCRRAC